MTRKEILTKRLERLQAKKNDLAARNKAAESADEVRSLTATLEDVNAEIEETREEIKAIETEERASGQQAGAPVNGDIVGAFRATAPKAETRDENKFESMEYRRAFMAYVLRGQTIPAEYRNGEVIDTTDTGAVIPLTIMNEVINTVRKRYGNLYSKVTKTSVPGGVEYPAGALQATFKWTTESTVSPRQKVGEVGKISFGYHTAEIRIAQTFISQLLSINAFEAKIAEIIAIAYLQAMDEGIVSGSGKGQMTGILHDARVTKTVTLTAAQFKNWTAWRKDFFSKLPLGYRSGEFIFPVSTVDTYLETMSDANNNPIFNQATGLVVNDGDAANPNGRFFGRNISLVEPDIIEDFDTANQGNVVGIFWQPEEYAINENFGFTMRRYFDEETNEYVNKAIVVVDGKILNPNGFVKILKG